MSCKSHEIEESGASQSACTPEHNCHLHLIGHQHGEECGHEVVPHGDHLHHPCDGHCDDHGKVA